MIDWKDLVFTRFESRSGWRALAYTAMSVAAAMALVPGLLRPYPVFAKDGHMRTSFTQALGSAFCHSRRFSNRFEIVSALDRHPDWMNVAIADVVEREAGSIPQYCSTLTIPVVNNENSLFLVMRTVMFVNPWISTAGLGATAAGVRIVFVAALCFALFVAGASLMTGVTTAVLACCVLGSLAPYQYGQSPFVFATPVLLIATCVLLLRMEPSTSVAAVFVFAAFALIVVFCVNMRTSQIPGVLAVLGAVFVTRRRLALISVAVFVVVAASTQLTMTRMLDDPGASGLSYHSISHAMVLALAVPPNALSAREGIAWDDATGLKIAERLNPGVRYLSGEYERTLRRYYASLWLARPLEMLGIYWTKLSAAGSGVLSQAADTLNQWWMPKRITSWIGRHSLSGVPLLIGIVATIAAGWILYRATGSHVALALVLLALFALATLFECALVLPTFYVFYHGVLLFYVLMIPVALLQIAADISRALAWRIS